MYKGHQAFGIDEFDGSSECQDGHIEGHTCEICGRAFKKRYDLKRHERMHTGVKPYSCSVCFKQFSRKDNYVTHIRMKHFIY